MKRLLTTFAVLAVAVCVLAGCSSTSNPTAKDFEPKKDDIKIDQIDWSAENAVMDKYRRIAFSYTNNSNFDIVSLELDMSLKPDVTPEDLRQACEALKENGWTEKQLSELSDATQEQIARFTLSGDWNQIVAPGEKSGQDPMTLGYAYINTMEQFDLFEPSMMTIKYLAGEDKLYEETYDFKTKTYSLSSDVIDTHQWSDSELASLLPQPEGLLVTEISDSETRFTFETLGTTPAEFKSYVAACKEKGFTKEPTEGDSFFYVKSSDGKYKLDLYYHEESGDITAYLDVV